MTVKAGERYVNNDKASGCCVCGKPSSQCAENCSQTSCEILNDVFNKTLPMIIKRCVAGLHQRPLRLVYNALRSYSWSILADKSRLDK